jgi:hypothetical protein
MKRRETVAAVECGLAGEIVGTFREVCLRVFSASVARSILPVDRISARQAGVS